MTHLHESGAVHQSNVTGKALRALQEDVTIAVLRRPTLGWTMKGTGLSERYFPRDLRAAFKIAMTLSQDEIRRLVVVKDYRIWPLYGKRIIEWRDGQARAAARQLVHSIGCSEHDDPASAVHPDGSPESTEEQPWPVESQSSGDNRSAVFAAPDNSQLLPPIDRTPDTQSLFRRTLAAIKDIFGDLEEITSKRIVDKLTQIEAGPWAEWGKGKKPITQNALARLLRPYKVFPVDVGPEHTRRKGYKRAQFELLFREVP